VPEFLVACHSVYYGTARGERYNSKPCRPVSKFRTK
jgi:hypothetical protein